MKLITYYENEQYELGILTDQGIFKVSAAAEYFSEYKVPKSIHETIESGHEGVEALQQLVNKALQVEQETQHLFCDPDSVKYGPCVTHPNKIICIGLNYRKHAEEVGISTSGSPTLFNKFNNTLAGHNQDIVLPNVSQQVDYEGELVIVIGKHARDITPDEALDYVFGYCAANDLSARDLQMMTRQWLLGKSCDGFAPIGPYLVTADEVGDPNDLDIKTYLNGVLCQNSNTSQMIFHCREIISFISRHFTLLPGDIIFTGTPEGSIIGHPPEQQIYLKHGDEVIVEIEKLGSLKNRMVSL